MVRKDLDKETERPHYYSQFWLDVAAGRRVIGAGKGAQEAEEAETSETEHAAEASAKGGKGAKGGAPAPVVDAEPATSGQTSQPLRLSGTESLADLAAAAGLVDMEPVEEIPTLEDEEVTEEELEPLPSPEVEYEAEPVEETDEEESYDYGDLYEEEEEEEEEWTPSRRGKKHKKPDKPRRRERGRDF